MRFIEVAKALLEDGQHVRRRAWHPVRSIVVDDGKLCFQWGDGELFLLGFMMSASELLENDWELVKKE